MLRPEEKRASAHRHRIPERDGHRGIRARGFDYATLLRALFDVYRHDLDPAHLVWAEALAKEALAQLRDADGLLAETSEEEQFAGHAVYSGLMVFGESTWGTIYGPLARLFRLTGNPEFGQTASAIRARLAPAAKTTPILHTDFLQGALSASIDTVVYLTGNRQSPGFESLHRALLEPRFASLTVVHLTDGLPASFQRPEDDEGTKAIVVQAGQALGTASDPAELAALLDQVFAKN